MDRQITTLSKDQVRTNLQGLIDSGDLKGIRSDGVNTNIAVDTLSRPADTNVDRGIEAVNGFQDRGASPALTADVGQALATPPPQALTPDQGRNELEKLRLDIAGTDIAGDRQQVRKDLQIAEKEERARTLSNQMIARERDIQREIERMEKNPEGQSRAGLNATLNTYRRESARELADMSFSYNVALGDYQAAEKIAKDYMEDIKQELELKQQTFQNLFTLVQNDMTESEKLQAQQAFAEKQAQTSFEQQQKMAQFNQTLQQSDPMYKAQLARLRAENALIGKPTAKDIEEERARIQNSETAVASLEDKLDMFSGILGSKAMDSVVGPSGLSRAPTGIGSVLTRIGASTAIGAAGGSVIPGAGTIVGAVGGFATGVGLSLQGSKDYLTGDRADFIASVEQIIDKEFLDNLINVKSKGATFGALSDAEGAALRKAATKLGSWRITDKQGNVLGYKASEASFKQEIEKLQTLTQVAIYRAQGDMFTDTEKASFESAFTSFNPEAFY